MHQALTTFSPIVTVTDAWWRRFKDFSDFLTAAGFPKTADTGQVNWTTVTAPVAQSTYNDYEIRRFDDGAQSVNPVFMKIGFGYHTISTYQNPHFRIEFGSGTDGAGNITNSFNPGDPVMFLLTNLAGVSSRPWLMSADASGFALMGTQTSTIARTFIAVERGRDANGDAIPEIVLAYRAMASGATSPALDAPRLDVIDVETGTRPLRSGSLPVNYARDLSIATTSLSMGREYGVGVLSVPTRYGTARAKMFVGVAIADFNDESVIDVTRFGSTLVPYRVEMKDGVLAGVFGMSPSGVVTTVSDTPSAYAMPAIFWD